MGRRAVGDAQKGKLLEAFRSDPEPGSAASFRRAGQAAGTDFRTARKAWLTGWPGFRAIRETIESERVLARAALRPETLEQRLTAATALAVEDAVENRARQGQYIRLLTAAAGREYGEVYQAKDALLADTDEARAALRSHRQYADLLGKLSEIIERAQRMESIVLGTPTSIIGGEVTLRPAAPVNVDAATVAAEAEAALRAAEEMKALEAKKAPDGNGTSAVPN